MDLDLVIRGGLVVDGTGRPRFRADVGIRGGKIAAISTGEPLSGRQALDAAGLAVAPGFIDVHSHFDWMLPLSDHDRILTPFLLQGVTTVVTGQCGFSPAPVTERSMDLVHESAEMLRERPFPYRWRSVAEFLDTLERDGLLLNAAFLVGHGTLRYAAMGERANTAALPTDQEMEMLGRLTRTALREGAFGLSAGLAYVPGVFARNEELVPLLRTVAEEGSMFAVHGRAYTWLSSFYKPVLGGAPHNLRSVRELLALARQTGARLQLSHQIFVGRHTWRTAPAVLREIERAAADGIDVAFDAFPYSVGNTTIKVVFPDWFLDGFAAHIDDPLAMRRLKRETDLLRWTVGIDYRDIVLMWAEAPELAALEGMNFREVARCLKRTPFDAYAHVTRSTGGRARVLMGTYSGDGGAERPLRAVLSHPLCAFMTDAFLFSQGWQNPAAYGAFPRVLGRYSRDLGLFSLEEAVRRMTSLPAARIGLRGVGRVVEGGWGDLVVFDPATVAHDGSREHPTTPPTGIRAVLLSGQPVVRDGQVVDPRRHGRLLRS